MGKDLLLALLADGRLLLWKLDEAIAARALVNGSNAGSSEENLLVNETPVRELETFSEASGDCRVRCMVHPQTYVNKVLVGGDKGRMELWNFSTGALVYTFNLGMPSAAASGKKGGLGNAVCSLASAPALDVVAVGLADGSVRLVNIRYDQVLFTLGGAAEAAGVGVGGQRASASCVSFSTSLGRPLLAVGGSRGVITVWDLEKRKVRSVIKDAHGDDGGVSSLYFFPGEPLLLSTGTDNAMKFWVFDNKKDEQK